MVAALSLSPSLPSCSRSGLVISRGRYSLVGMFDAQHLIVEEWSPAGFMLADSR